MTLLAKSALALAAMSATPYVAAGYEYQSNPFYEWNGQGSGAAGSDTLRKLRAGMDARLASSLQSLVMSAEVRRFDYNNLSELSHTEYLLDGSFRYAVSSVVNGNVEYRHEHRMVPFDELPPDVREPYLETEDLASASVNVLTRTGWSLESRGKIRNLASPRPGLPDLDLRESSLHEALRRTLGGLAVGLDAEYLSGSYTGAGQLGTSRYTQMTVLLAAERKVVGLSTFESAVGYTQRTQSQPGGDLSAFTGTFGYERELTGKSSAGLLLTRAINNYVTAAGSEIDTSLALHASWQASAKVKVTSAYSLVSSDFPRQPFDPAPGRHDRYQVVGVDIRYQALDSLSLRTYGRYDLRASNVPNFGFNASAVGLELVFKEPP